MRIKSVGDVLLYSALLIAIVVFYALGKYFIFFHLPGLLDRIL